MNVQITLFLPRDGKTVSLVRAVAADALGRFGVAGSCIDDIGLALSEACGNVVRHAESSDEYEVRVEIDDERCMISVIDAGHGLDLTNITLAMPEPFSSSGRGVALMGALSDWVDITSEPESGTMVRLVKTLSLTPGGPLDRLSSRS